MGFKELIADTQREKHESQRVKEVWIVLLQIIQFRKDNKVHYFVGKHFLSTSFEVKTIWNQLLSTLKVSLVIKLENTQLNSTLHICSHCSLNMIHDSRTSCVYYWDTVEQSFHSSPSFILLWIFVSFQFFQFPWLIWGLNQFGKNQNEFIWFLWISNIEISIYKSCTVVEM